MPLKGIRFLVFFEKTAGNLNDDRQGEGGTLAVIIGNITMTPKKNQAF